MIFLLRDEPEDVLEPIKKYVPADFEKKVRQIWEKIPEKARNKIESEVKSKMREEIFILPLVRYNKSGNELKSTLAIISAKNGIRMYDLQKENMPLILTEELLKEKIMKPTPIGEIEEIEVRKMSVHKYSIHIEMQHYWWFFPLGSSEIDLT